MFDAVDRTLDQLLRRGLTDKLVEPASISFAPPGSDLPPPSVTLPSVNLFLYEVRENLDLRTNDRRIERRLDGTAQLRPAPLWVDCGYLVTAWSSESSPTRALDEHKLLGEVLRILLAFPTVPQDLREGSLRDEDAVMRLAVLQPSHLQSIGDFWQAMGGRPKPAVTCTATIAIPAAKVPDERLVLKETVRFGLHKGEV
jgi:uncharacterized protein DUF4255